MKQITYLVIAGCLTLLPLTAWSGDDGVLEAETMVGVQGPFLGNANPVREIPGGGLPWVLDEAKVELERDGQLEVEVEGLIIPPDSGPGNNPVAFFRAIVSCLSIDHGGNVATVEAEVALPALCIAPVVFVTSPGGAWFAATGF